MFIDRLLSLCAQKGTDVSNVLRSLGLSTSKGTAWRKGSIPNGEILLMLAEYFNTSTDYLLGNTDDPAPPGEPAVPQEYLNALSQAQTYSDKMHMSKRGIFDQLISEYGGKFQPEAAQYAIDNVDADFNANALETAKVYYEKMNLSKEDVRDQLTSAYGARFTQEEADYAIDHLD